MQAVKSKDTKPEMAVRRLVHSMGYRYRLHKKGLPGRPDLVFGPRRKVIFVHGCFWHVHDCKYFRMPASNTDYWLPKLRRNQERDAENRAALCAMGWQVLTVWECAIKDTAGLAAEIRHFLDGPQP